MKYGVKVICTYSVGENCRKYYEQSVLSVNADSFDEAYKKAEKYVNKNCDEHTNPNGECVKTEKVEFLDCFLAMDEEEDVQEIYAAYTKNKTPLKEEEFYNVITDQCHPDELYDLRYAEFN
ncbi:MAG: DUF4288 domain-containing protein [Clostridia bacterium]|nr:DUF4288 domain-containing protein [Clostridia bacterium]